MNGGRKGWSGQRRDLRGKTGKKNVSSYSSIRVLIDGISGDWRVSFSRGKKKKKIPAFGGKGHAVDLRAFC